MIWIISSRADLETYVDNCHPDAVEHGFAEALVDALQAAPHPDYGRDWADWLSDNAAGWLASIERAASDPERDTPEERLADHLHDLAKDG